MGEGDHARREQLGTQALARAATLTWDASALGSVIPPEVLDRWLYVIIAVVIALSILPTAIHIYRSNRQEINARVRSRGRHGAVGPKADEPGT